MKKVYCSECFYYHPESAINPETCGNNEVSSKRSKKDNYRYRKGFLVPLQPKEINATNQCKGFIAIAQFGEK